MLRASIPSCSRARGRDPSITTSARPISAARRARPTSVVRSSATDSLRPWIDSKKRRARRPPSGRRKLSTVMIRAPSRASTSAHSGPAQSAARSRTTASSSVLGSAPASWSAMTGRPSACSPTRAHGNPNSAACSISAAAVRPAATSEIRRHGASSGSAEPSPSASTPSHAGTRARSSSRASDTASQPSAHRTKRLAPPALIVPDGLSPIVAARSASKPSPRLSVISAIAAPSRSRPSTRPTTRRTSPSGTPTDGVGQPCGTGRGPQGGGLAVVQVGILGREALVDIGHGRLLLHSLIMAEARPPTLLPSTCWS